MGDSPIFTEEEKRRQAEFADLVNAAGWKAVEAARAAELSKASVSKILSGKQTPRPQTLEVFRNRVAAHLGRAPSQHYEIKPQAMELQEQATKLEEIKRANPEGYHAAKVMIETLYRSTPKGKRAAGVRVSSKRVSEQAAASVDDAIALSSGNPKPAPKRGVDVPNAHKRRPTPGVEKE